MNTCGQYESAISCYVDGEIAHRESAEMFSHLASCERCADFLHDVIQIRLNTAREGKVPAPRELDFFVAPLGSKAVSRLSPNASAAVNMVKPRSIGVSIRTLALAVLIIVIGCVMFSTTISFGARGPAMIQSPQESRVR
jgi:anti-sigma factor RsiW